MRFSFEIPASRLGPDFGDRAAAMLRASQRPGSSADPDHLEAKAALFDEIAKALVEEGEIALALRLAKDLRARAAEIREALS